MKKPKPVQLDIETLLATDAPVLLPDHPTEPSYAERRFAPLIPRKTRARKPKAVEDVVGADLAATQKIYTVHVPFKDGIKTAMAKIIATGLHHAKMSAKRERRATMRAGFTEIVGLRAQKRAEARNLKRVGGDADAVKPQYTQVFDDCYITLHPTKGFRRVSYKRLEAISAMQAAR